MFVFFHNAANDENPYHTHCPGSDSWCRYQQDKANKTSLYKHGPIAGLPKDVIPEPTGRGLLIPHGYLHPGKSEHSEV